MTGEGDRQLELLEMFRENTKQHIRELRELAEWDTFTIAFYGETNAGKSTLIETLRILLGDSEGCHAAAIQNIG